MSSLQDPFELLKSGQPAGSGKGQEMDNIMPFLSQKKIDEMIGVALATPQLSAPRERKVASNWNLTSWKLGSVALAACLALMMVFLPEAETPVLQQPVQTNVSQASGSTEDVGEFNELVMLESWERY